MGRGRPGVDGARRTAEGQETVLGKKGVGRGRF